MKKYICLAAILVFILKVAMTLNAEVPSGEGNFNFYFNNESTTDTVKVFYYIPTDHDRKEMQVVVGFHGNDRNCSYWIDTWKEYASEKGFMFFIPWFTNKDFPTWRYQEAGVKNDRNQKIPVEFRTTSLVDSLLAEILETSGTDDTKVTLYGHSAGGQFLHRFLMLDDTPLVKKTIIGNPGWYTFPTLEEEYSYGIRNLEEVDEKRLKTMLGKNVILQLGLGDTVRESFLRKTPEADRQGLNRLERGDNFFESLLKKSEELHTDFNWRKVYVDDIGHDAVAMSRHAAQNLLSDSVLIYIPGDKSVTMPSDWLHRYDDEINDFVKKSYYDTDTVCHAVFIGSSSIRLWPDLEKTMFPLKVKQRGYGGAMMRDLMRNYKRVTAHYQPKNIVFYCDNDICGWTEGDLSVNQVFSLYKTFIGSLHRDYPHAKILFLSIKHSLSRQNLRPSQEQLNSLMKAYSETDDLLIYVDVTSALLTENGDINDTLFQDDHLHLNEEGYKRWNEIVKPLLE